MTHRQPPSRATETRRHGAGHASPTDCRGLWLVVALLCGWVSLVDGQQILLDRVVARVGGVAITETDVRAAAGLGIIALPPEADVIADGTRAMIDRQLILQEVNRFAPPDPGEVAVNEAVAEMKARSGGELQSLMRSTGLDDERLRELARETLRIQAYVSQRFGTTAQASLQDARDYYDKHPAEFTRDGTLLPFNQAESAARAAASNERRQVVIAQWLLDLRARGEIVEVRRP